MKTVSNQECLYLKRGKTLGHTNMPARWPMHLAFDQQKPLGRSGVPKSFDPWVAHPLISIWSNKKS